MIPELHLNGTDDDAPALEALFSGGKAMLCGMPLGGNRSGVMRSTRGRSRRAMVDPVLRRIDLLGCDINLGRRVAVPGDWTVSLDACRMTGETLAVEG